MFGKLIALWLADLWTRAGSPEGARYEELGPGRGTLAADAIRAMASTGLRPEIHLVETSPSLKQAQAARLANATWHQDVGSLPRDRPLLIVANEFFDALPCRQLVATESGWRERLVTYASGAFKPLPGPPAAAAAIPEPIRAAPAGSIIETSPASLGAVRQLSDLLAATGGAALIIDYGHESTRAGETLQAVVRHSIADPWTAPGERDLTVHVDFEALGAAAAEAGAAVFGPVKQGEWLRDMGIEVRAATLARAAPARAPEIEAARRRLTAPDQMGDLFKVMALLGEGWPAPAGFPAPND